MTITTHGKDRYGRTIGDITLPDGKNLNTELVKAGYAWWYRKYAPNNTTLQQLEDQARKRKIGLWHEPVVFSTGPEKQALARDLHKFRLV